MLPARHGFVVCLRAFRLPRSRYAPAAASATAVPRLDDALRLRIARDLHDAVGHQIALINVQAGVAEHVLDASPAQAKEALAHIRQASRTALGELGTTVGLLRQPGEPAVPTEPAAGLSGLNELIESHRRAGLRVSLDADGGSLEVPADTGIVAYRVIQESLTNIRKHAGDPAGVTVTVRLTRRPGALRVVIEDDGRGATMITRPNGDSSGHGIPGMRERATALGGTLEVGPRPGGGFRVTTELPLQSRGARPARSAAP